MTDFETELVAVQPALIAYINVLCGVPREVRDILGETNLALVRHRDAYDASRPFLPWARAFALQAVRHWWSGQRREHVVFDDQLLDALDETMARMQDPGESDVFHRRGDGITVFADPARDFSRLPDGETAFHIPVQALALPGSNVVDRYVLVFPSAALPTNTAAEFILYDFALKRAGTESAAASTTPRGFWTDAGNYSTAWHGHGTTFTLRTAANPPFDRTNTAVVLKRLNGYVRRHPHAGCRSWTMGPDHLPMLDFASNVK